MKNAPGTQGKRMRVGAAILWFFIFCSCVFAEPYTYKYEGKRDPFVSLISPAGFLVNLEPEDNSTLRLQGIMFDSKGDSMAVINGEMVRVGETIGDSVISRIEENKVTVIQNNQKIDLELRREE